MSKNGPLEGQLKSIIENKKVEILIDGANLYFAAYKKKIPVDFEQIFKWFDEHCNLKQIIYYTAYNPLDEKQNEFIRGLEVTGYKVQKKLLKVFSDDSKKGNLDVEICVDALTEINRYDVLVLISGDGDFTYLLQELERKGKLVIVIGVGGFMSHELHKQADNYFFLERIKPVWRKPRKANPVVSIPVVSVKDDSVAGSLEQKPDKDEDKIEENLITAKTNPSKPARKKTRSKKQIKPVVDTENNKIIIDF